MNIIEEAEAIAFYEMMDGDAFASYVVDEQETVNINGKDYRIADFCERDTLKGFWQGCIDKINEWAPEFPERRRKVYAIWFALGVISGYLWGKVENES